MADPEFEIYRGRIFPAFQTQLSGPGVDDDGQPLIPDYTAWTVRFRLLKDGVIVFEKAATWVNPATAVARYSWVISDTNRDPGRYEGKWLVFDPSGNPGPAYPSNRYHSIRIEGEVFAEPSTPDLTTPPQPRYVVFDTVNTVADLSALPTVAMLAGKSFIVVRESNRMARLDGTSGLPEDLNNGPFATPDDPTLQWFYL